MAARTMKLVANSLIKLANLVDAKVLVVLYGQKSDLQFSCTRSNNASVELGGNVISYTFLSVFLLQGFVEKMCMDLFFCVGEQSIIFWGQSPKIEVLHQF